MKLKIGVMGSAHEELTSELIEKVKEIGQHIAKNDCILLTGAGTGLPYEAVKSTKENGGFVVGFSPASNFKEHTEILKLPSESFDILVFTGLGFRGRCIPLIKSCDGIIVISGGVGTLNEVSIALYEGRPVGVLTQTGGLTEKMKEISNLYNTKDKTIIYNSNPESLVKALINEITKK